MLVSVERDSFRVEGVGCWCPGEMTLYTIRIMGHTKECTIARHGWEENYRDSSEIDRRRAADAEVGRQLREAATQVIEAQNP